MSLVVQPEELIEQVTQIQRSKGYTDQEMADRLGCSRQTYNQTRTGKKQIGNTFLNGALRFLSTLVPGKRTAVIRRETRETNITLELNIDGTGEWDINTGIFMFDHLLSQVIKHGRFDLKLKAAGDDPHHLIEDIAICLGQALNKALGDKQGITRMDEAIVPMDDSLSMVAIDISGRAYPVLEIAFNGNDMGDFKTDLIRHFLETLTFEARLNLHANILYGTNDHHRAESLFKALGRALDKATIIDERISGKLPSTKGLL